jgi:hypothetical protein
MAECSTLNNYGTTKNGCLLIGFGSAACRIIEPAVNDEKSVKRLLQKSFANKQAA